MSNFSLQAIIDKIHKKQKQLAIKSEERREQWILDIQDPEFKKRKTTFIQITRKAP